MIISSSSRWCGPSKALLLARGATVLSPQAGVEASGTTRLRVQVVEIFALQLLKLC